jgi:hypothetical protein
MIFRYSWNTSHLHCTLNNNQPINQKYQLAGGVKPQPSHNNTTSNSRATNKVNRCQVGGGA